MTVPYTLLVVARTQSLAKRLQSTLDAEQYVTRWAPSSTQALRLLLDPSLVIIDLPPSGGAQSVARLKRFLDVPLLAIARAGQPRPANVEAFLVEPFETQQLAALIQTTLMTHAPDIVQAETMSLDIRNRRLQVDGMLFQLRPIGCRILALLMSRAGRIVSREELFRRVWHTEDGDRTRALDVHIAYLRGLLEADPRNPKLIVTERGIGYRLQLTD